MKTALARWPYLILMFSLLLVHCADEQAPPFDEAAWVARGQATLQPFKQNLQGALRAGLAEGPAAAIEVCRVEAPQIVADLQTDGVLLGRTSHRLRNPANEPAPWLIPQLEAYRADTSRVAQAITLEDGRVGYVEPIYMQPLCVTCHGSQLAPEIEEQLAALYPQDQAVEFAEGDFRGLFWVTFPAPTP